MIEQIAEDEHAWTSVQHADPKWTAHEIYMHGFKRGMKAVVASLVLHKQLPDWQPTASGIRDAGDLAS